VVTGALGGALLAMNALDGLLGASPGGPLARLAGG
jgi:hypothetical protein